jgi:serine/threonine protein kinase/tetratricopeptide (TPR) repeat protein
MSQSAPDPSATTPNVPENPLAPYSSGEHVGTHIGPYKLLQVLGEGGMGTVWVAEQQQPVKRRVALKVIKAGMDSAQVLRRFEAERQAVALMDHTHIAKVLDAGTTEAGRPYFAMELVQGVPISRYCDELRLTIRERLELFVPVCQAIQHAHQKGIIHRDIKPSNVLVCMQDGKPVAKVIDFGLAKALSQPLSERTVYTEFGAVVGTLEYMAPEQAETSPLGVDTRSDIYSLGVLLYEMLTGTTPLDARRLKTAGLAEMVRMIKEDEPSKPSTRLTQSKESLASLAAQRKTAPAQLQKLVRGELDWIVMKCLEKDRTRRYETAGGLARDVERHLHDESVEASPPSARYRLHKFVRRNRGAVLAAASLVILLLAGIAGTCWGLVLAERARGDAVLAKETAEAREAETGAVLDFVDKKVVAAARPKESGGLGYDVTVRRALEAALPFVAESFSDQPLTEARLRMTLGLSFWNLGEFKIAADQYQAARVIYTRQLGPDHPDTILSMIRLAHTFDDIGRHADALKLNEETQALCKSKLGPDHLYTHFSMNNLAISYGNMGLYADAVKLNEETLKLRKAKLGADHADTLLSMNNLANSYAAMGRHADALKLNEQALTLKKARLGPDHPDTLLSMEGLAANYAEVGRQADALELREQTLALRKAKLGPDHSFTLDTMIQLAVSYAALLRHDDALKLLDERHALQARLGPDRPLTLYNIACVYATIARSPDHASQGDVAMGWLKKAVSAGWKNAQHTKTDPDLAALRGRDDFKKLIANLEVEIAKQKK